MEGRTINRKTLPFQQKPCTPFRFIFLTVHFYNKPFIFPFKLFIIIPVPLTLLSLLQGTFSSLHFWWMEKERETLRFTKVIFPPVSLVLLTVLQFPVAYSTLAIERLYLYFLNFMFLLILLLFLYNNFLFFFSFNCSVYFPPITFSSIFVLLLPFFS